MRLLLVEDSVSLADQLLAMLRGHGYAVDWLADGRDALVRLHDEPYDLVILDLGLPGLDGLELLAQWRRQGSNSAVLILTARDSWAERVDGLRAGADDYLTKPFHPDELLLRVRAVLRRSHGSTNQARLGVGGVELDEERQSAWRGDQEITLTGAEFRLLRYFMLNQGKLLSKSQISEHLYDGERERDSNVVEVHVNRLRGKLGTTAIQTRRGQGYVFTGTLP